MTINNITDLLNEPSIDYSHSLRRHLTWIWNLRITYPGDEILLWDDDISAAFRQLKHHVDIAGAFSIMLSGYLMIYAGSTFGSNTSPSNFEEVSRARTSLMRQIQLLHPNLDIFIEKHRIAYLDKIQFSALPNETTSFAPAYSDDLNPGVLDETSVRQPTPCHMFVDNDLYANVHIRIHVDSFGWTPA